MGCCVGLFVSSSVVRLCVPGLACALQCINKQTHTRACRESERERERGREKSEKREERSEESREERREREERGKERKDLS